MFPTIHSFEANDLTTQGYGALSDCISCDVTEELNGAFTLEMKYPLKGIHYEQLIPGNVIVAKPSHNQSAQPFRISDVKQSFANSITVYANHISYDMSGYTLRLPRSYNSLADVISDMNSFDWSGQGGVYHDFTFDTDMTSSHPFSMPALQTLRSWMGGQEGSIIDVYGGEWIYNGFSCFLTSRRGEDTGIRISYGKNLAEYEKERSNNEYSHVCAWWKKSDTTVVSDLVPTGVNCTFRVAYTDASKEYENQPSTAQLNQSATNAIAKLNPIPTTIKVTPAQIGNDVIGLGDSVLICYESVFKTRVIKTVWDALAGEYKTLELGTKKASIADTIKSLSGSSSSATEGEPLDYITDYGTDGDWTYRKWHSGMMECWYRKPYASVACTSSWGQLKYGTLLSGDGLSYPQGGFSAYPTVEWTAQLANGSGWIAPNHTNYSATKTGGAFIYSPQSNSYDLTLNIYAKGYITS